MVNLFRHIRRYGLGRTIIAGFHRITVPVSNRVLHSILHPTIGQMYDLARSMHVSSMDLFTTYFAVRANYITNIIAEYEELVSELARRYAKPPGGYLEYPVDFEVEKDTSLLLYAIVRILKPLTVVETGVANGRSSFFLLNALIRNGKGKLYSIDIAGNVGRLITNNEKQSWELKILSGSNVRDNMARYVISIPPIDLFLHDSDHTYYWQSFEYACAYGRLNDNGLLVTDDCDSSFAFFDFCIKKNIKPIILLEKRKAIGLIINKIVGNQSKI